MKSLLENFGVALCGLTTSILIALAEVAVTRMTGFNFFTFSVWLIVPAGALFTGFAAASGYYFGSLYFHKRSSKALLVQMVLIAGATQLLIYWVGYVTMIFDDGRKVADFVPFAEYMDVILTKAHYSVGRSRTDTGEVGDLGYWLAGLQFLGFLVGGLCIFSYLSAKRICIKCNLYLRHLAGNEKRFVDAPTASGYFDRLFTFPVGGPDFVALIRSHETVDKPIHGALQVSTSLLGCPTCKDQIIAEKVQGFNGQDWKDLSKLDRITNLQPGIDLTTVFRA